MAACKAVRRCAGYQGQRQPCRLYNRHGLHNNQSPRQQRDRILCRIAEYTKAPFQPPLWNEHGQEVDAEGRTKMTIEEGDEDFEEIIHDLSPAPYQQTLNRSFTVGGLGLHTGEEVVVRVMPAFAGDGRYFVRVPEGTNKQLAMGGDPIDEEDRKEALAHNPELDHQQTQAFMQYSKAQDDQGYPGTFEDYILDAGLDVDVGGLNPVVFDNTQEDIIPKPTDGSALDASVRNFAGRTPFCQLLGSQDPKHPKLQVAAAEILLAVMEGLHVDNARIEFEGACEMPILDGSGQFWVEKIAAVGLTPAYEEGKEELVRKQSWRPNTPISVFDHDSFITLYPAGLYRRITAGVEPLDAPVIGSQWFSLEACAGTDPVRSFAIDVAPARTWISTVQLAHAARDAGYLKAGTTDCVIVADGESWRENAELRFYGDEPARHAVMDVMGDLALLGDKGNSGLPCGHIVAFNASHDLVMDFVIHCAEAIESGDVQEFPFMLLPSEMDYVRQVQCEMMDDMLEKADYQGDIDPQTGKMGSRKYVREPFAGENGEHFADDQPPLEESDPARYRVRREIDILREAVEQRVQTLHEEAKEIERDAAEEIAAIRRGETPKPRTEVIMHMAEEEEEPQDENVIGVHEDEYEQGGILVPEDDPRLRADIDASPPAAEAGSTGVDQPSADEGKGDKGSDDSGL